MTLQYLDFDYSEDADGHGVFDAMASTAAAQVPAVHAEIARVLGWAFAHFPDACAPREDGGEWSYDLSGQRETSTPETLDYDEATGHIAVCTGTPGPSRHSITFAVAGTAAFCDALREAFGLD